jgi:hypothetical protein
MLDNYKSILNETVRRFPLIGQALVHHRNTRGKPMSFVDMPYLAQMYRDIPNHDNVCIRKAVQTGLSELMICMTLYHAGWLGKIVAYILPTFSVRDRFVNQRINKVLTGTKSYRDLLPRAKDIGNNRMKRLGEGSILFLGSNTAGDFVEFSADTIIVDEIDQCDADNLEKAKDRVRASSDPRMFRLGNPTLPTIGISTLFKNSDQRFWFTQCPHCNKWQNLDWFENVVMKNDLGNWIPRDEQSREGLVMGKIDTFTNHVRAVCKFCNKPFERRNTGEWIPKYEQRDSCGYSMSRLDILSQSLSELYVEWVLAQGNTAKISTFYTSVLGMPFEFSGARITTEMLSLCQEEYELDYGGGDHYRDETVSMGVDVGSLLHVTISIAKVKGDQIVRKTVLIMTCRSFEELQDLIIRYHVNCCVIDSMPETRKAQELRDWAIMNGVYVWLCRFFPTPRVASQKYGRKLSWKDKVITVDRTQIMDTTFDEFRNQERILPIDCNTILGYFEQMKAPVRVLDQNKSRIIWAEGSAADHFRFSDVYDKLAFDLTSSGGTFGTL